MKLEFKKMGQGAPFVILHGLYGSSDNWFSIAKIFAQKFEVFLPDQRNHGHSPHSSELNYEILANDLYEFLSAHSLQKAIILGHSMGGKTAMLFATMHPEMVESLIIVDIAPKAYKSLTTQHPHVLQHLNILNAMMTVDVAEKKSRAEIEHEFSLYVPEAAIRHFLLKNVSRNNDGKFKWNINVKALHDSLPQLLDGLNLEKFNVDISLMQFPVLFIRGEKSDYISDEDIVDLKKYFPKSELITIFDAGHWVHSEQPDLFVKSVNYFLEK